MILCSHCKKNESLEMKCVSNVAPITIVRLCWNCYTLKTYVDGGSKKAQVDYLARAG